MLRIIKKLFVGLLTALVNRSNHKMCVSLNNQTCQTFNLPLLVYIPINAVKNFNTIHFWLNKKDELEVVTLWMIYLVKYVFQIKYKI